MKDGNLAELLLADVRDFEVTEEVGNEFRIRAHYTSGKSHVYKVKSVGNEYLATLIN